MRKLCIRLLCTTLVLSIVLICATAFAATQSSLLDYQKAVVSLCNQSRSVKKIPGLALDTELSAIALKLAMEQEGYTGEAGMRPNGKEWSTVFADYGYSYVEVSHITQRSATNISSRELVKLWMNDKKQSASVLYSRYTRTGVNMYYSKTEDCYYFAQVFARPVSLSFNSLETPYLYGAIATANVNVRAGAGTDFSTTGFLAKNQAVKVASVSGKWAKIFWDNSAYAYVSTSYIKKSIVPGTAQATASVNIRTGPGTKYEKFALLEKSTMVNVLAIEGAWAEIDPTAIDVSAPKGQKLYIGKEYLKQLEVGFLIVQPK